MQINNSQPGKLFDKNNQHNAIPIILMSFVKLFTKEQELLVF